MHCAAALTFPKLPHRVASRLESCSSHMITPDRRLLLAALSGALLPPSFSLAATPGVRLGPARDFSFAGLVAAAKKNATEPYKAPVQRAAQIIRGIDFDAA